MKPNRRVLAVAALAVVMVVAGVVGWRWLDDDGRLASAVALAPEDSQRLNWTDWSAVRAELEADPAGADGADLRAFLDESHEADLASTSAIVTSAPTLREKFGLSPANLSWELLAQAPDGQLIILGTGPDHDFDAFRDTLRSLGYTEPEEGGGTWQAGEVAFAQIGELTAELANLRLDEEEGVVVASESRAYLADWKDVRRGTGVDDGIDDTIGAYEESRALSAVVYSGDQACSELAMSQADGADGARATQLIDDAGEVHPLRGFGMAALPGGAVRVAMAFETEGTARTDADTRATLATGPAPGQGGTFPDRFRLGEVSARGRVVRMELAPTDGSYVLSDLTSGPVLFATC